MLTTAGPSLDVNDDRVATADGHKPLGVLALTVAICAGGFAIQQHGGEYTPVAMTLITIAVFASVVALLSSRNDHHVSKGRRAPVAVAAILMGLCLVAIFALWPVGIQQPREYRIGLGISVLILAAMAGISMLYRLDASPRQWRWWIDLALAGALLLQFFALFTLWPIGVDQGFQFLATKFRLIYLYLIAASGLLVLFGFLDIPAVRRWWFPALLIVHSVIGFYMVRISPVPRIDVWEFQELASDALMLGKNPYDASQVRFFDIYNSTLPGHQHVYGDGMVKDGYLQFGFPYPPVSLYCSTIGYALGGDTRYAQAMALTLAGLLIGYCRPGRMPKLAAVLLLFTPATWFLIGRAWTEPFVIFFLALTMFAAVRRIRWLMPIAFGLFLASKQYLVFAAPLSFLLVQNFQWRSRRCWRAWILVLLVAAIVAIGVTLPLALRDFHAFWFSLVTVQQDAPFRWDALSYLVWVGLHLDSKYTSWIWLAFVAAGLAMLLSLWKAARTPAGFAVALSLTYLVFIAFNKQAFCNYYFYVIGCLACGLAASAGPRESAQ